MSVSGFELPGSGGLPVRGDVWLPDHTRDRRVDVVVGIHGFKGFRKWGFWPAIAGALNAAGAAFVGYDASHNGVGPGGLEFDEEALFERNTWGREEEDLRIVLDALRGGHLAGADAIDPRRTTLLGHSRGGALAIVHAAQDPRIRSVVALAPIATLRRFPADEIERGRVRGFVPVVNTRTGQVLRYGRDALEELVARTDLHDIAGTYAARLAVPLLVVHGDDDTSVPPSEGRALAAAAPRGRFVGIAGGAHPLGCRHPWAGPTAAFETFLRELRALVG